MDYLKTLLIVIISIVRLGIIFSVPKLVTHDTTANTVYPNLHCTHTYDHISQQLNSLADSAQQHTLYTNEADASLFTTDTAIQCAFNIIPSNLDIKPSNDAHSHSNNNTGSHFYSKHKYRDTFDDAHIQYHDFIMVMHSFTKINTQHCYNKSYKTPIGVYMIQSQLKAIRYLQSWILKLCHIPCTLMAMQVQLLRLITSHIKLYSIMIRYVPCSING